MTTLLGSAVADTSVMRWLEMSTVRPSRASEVSSPRIQERSSRCVRRRCAICRQSNGGDRPRVMVRQVRSGAALELSTWALCHQSAVGARGARAVTMAGRGTSPLPGRQGSGMRAQLAESPAWEDQPHGTGPRSRLDGVDRSMGRADASPYSWARPPRPLGHGERLRPESTDVVGSDQAPISHGHPYPLCARQGATARGAQGATSSTARRGA